MSLFLVMEYVDHSLSQVCLEERVKGEITVSAICDHTAGCIVTSSAHVVGLMEVLLELANSLATGQQFVVF